MKLPIILKIDIEPLSKDRTSDYQSEYQPGRDREQIDSQKIPSTPGEMESKRRGDMYASTNGERYHQVSRKIIRKATQNRKEQGNRETHH